MVGLIRSTVPPIHPGGRPIVLGAAAATLAGRLLLRTLGLRRAGRGRAQQTVYTSCSRGLEQIEINFK